MTAPTTHQQLDAQTTEPLPTLGREYSDMLTGFSGVCTAIIIYADNKPQALLENSTSDRWVPLNRIGG